MASYSGMEILLILLWSQVLGVPERQELTAPALRQAAAEIEPWLGLRLVFYQGPPVSPMPASMLPVFPQPYDPAEASITPNGIYVSAQQAATFRTARAFAEFLSHAAAHARLGHAERMQQVAREALILNSTHAPERIAEELLARTRKEMEEAAAPVAAEILAASGCAAEACERFGSLLRELR